MPTNQQSQQQRKRIEDIATTILAHLDMERPEKAQEILENLDRHSLGMVMSIWYAMCVVHRGFAITSDAAFKTAEYLRTLGERDTIEESEGSPDRHAAALLNALTAGKMDKYARNWQNTIEHQPDITTDVAARLLGFTRGMLETRTTT